MKKKRGLFVILAGVVLLCVLIVCYVALLKVNSSEEKTTEEETRAGRSGRQSPVTISVH